MKETLRTSKNSAAMVRALADSHEEAARQLSLARQLRRDADRDIFQALDTNQELRGQLQNANDQFQALWGVVQYILSYIGHEGDSEMHLAQFIPLIPSRFYNFLRGSLRDCVSNLLSHFQGLASGARLERIVEADPPGEYLDQVAAVEPELAPLVDNVVDRLNLGDAPDAPAL